MMPVPTLDGTTVDMPPHFGGDELHTNPTEHDRRASTLVADLKQPFSCGLIRSTRPKKGSVLSCFWVAASPDDTPVLMGYYDASRIGRDMVDLIIQARYGTPDEVMEVEL
ncbi:hypothetical protein [Streptacidiphilus sp. EB103A]|uniref:hypothetical protein n=1 Tax=Streptacidiphilus sp. EB103A TaxID=3156275 RepID=UPI003510DEF2